MYNKSLFIACCAGLILGLAIPPLNASPQSTTDSLTELAQRAVSRDTNIASWAIAALRAKGPAGLEALLLVNSELIRLHDADGLRQPSANPQPAWDRLRTALDGVSGQRDCYASRLFWYTDLDEAQAAAKAAGKPILSLRLLGRLDEEYSCANSRFFRTTLYANAEISRYLKDHFILHWKSVRPVPRITVDFGDGRKIERTVTGNSIHYILAADGTPLDALPGLYSPHEFLKQLQTAEKEAAQYAQDTSADRYFRVRQYHGERGADARVNLTADLARVSNPSPGQAAAAAATPTALNAAPRAMGKFQVERPLLKSFQDIDDPTWKKIAALHVADAALDAASFRLIESKAPSAREAARITTSKGGYESPVIRMIQNLQRSIAEDTVRNEYSFHSTIHEWFATEEKPMNLEQLNARVYAQLFLTPDSDPWLGLVPADTFSGLDNNGLLITPQPSSSTIKKIK